jgi:hypothetical protein
MKCPWAGQAVDLLGFFSISLFSRSLWVHSVSYKTGGQSSFSWLKLHNRGTGDSFPCNSEL